DVALEGDAAIVVYPVHVLEAEQFLPHHVIVIALEADPLGGGEGGPGHQQPDHTRRIRSPVHVVAQEHHRVSLTAGVVSNETESRVETRLHPVYVTDSVGLHNFSYPQRSGASGALLALLNNLNLTGVNKNDDHTGTSSQPKFPARPGHEAVPEAAPDDHLLPPPSPHPGADAQRC